MLFNIISILIFAISASALDYTRPAQPYEETTAAAPAIKAAPAAVAKPSTPTKAAPKKKVYKKSAAPRIFANGIVADNGNSSDDFNIENIVLTPTVPKAGQPLDVHLVGKLKKMLDQGSRVFIKAKLDGRTIANFEMDLCGLARDRKFKHQCPAQPEDFDIHHTLMIPAGSPKGTYVFNAYGLDQDNGRIFNVSTIQNTRDSY
ncbi:Phosphatidylglycerol/phosphatidylinositol transfer protein [Entomophthora muscae]|uniref:Phosphatidylglycerol/phosphatidylinositol transfer protein n=1 Tax=Entomophthora muscae TaxID=34485 RepID=A0ACC2S4T8_9FUNG|nr:Phosphatidylglycerol/phosphatidylinositol transfer protein [Entomophthora muscae]